jgi:rhodanese-related sulfurtransferase
MAFIQNNWLLILVFVLSGGDAPLALCAEPLSPAKDLGNLELTRLLNSSNPVLVDLRETKEYEGEPVAERGPYSPVAAGEPRRRARPSQCRPVVAYCMTGNRSRMANRALARLGFTDIYNLRGGYRAWKDAGLPVEK